MGMFLNSLQDVQWRELRCVVRGWVFVERQEAQVGQEDGGVLGWKEVMMEERCRRAGFNCWHMLGPFVSGGRIARECGWLAARVGPNDVWLD